MRRPIAALAGALLLLAGCTRHDEQDANICGAPDPQVPTVAKTAADADRIVDNCIQQWGYRLSRANVPVADAANAVLNACSMPIATQVAMSVRSEREAGIQVDQQEDEARIRDEDRQAAAFAYIQGRAGHCRIDRVRDLMTGKLDQ